LVDKDSLFSKRPFTPESAPAAPPTNEGEEADNAFEKLLGDPPCASRPSRTAIRGLRIKRPSKPDQIMEYYGVDGVGSNTMIKIITGAHRIWELTITGRNLMPLLDYFKEHRLDWIRQADRDVYRDKEIFIESITPRKLSQDEAQAADLKV
jgi:hypothetical protein